MRGSLFSLPRLEDDKAEIEQAALDVAKEQYADAVERLRKLLLRGSQGVVPTESKSRWIGTRLATIQRLRDLPPVAKEAYEKLVQREAGALLRIPFAELSPRQLAGLAQDYPTSKVGIDARLRLGDLALEQGEGIEADAHFRAALDALAENDPRFSPTQRRASDVRALLGSQLTNRRGTTAYPPRNAQDKLAAERLAPLLAEPPNERLGWPCYGGGASGLVPMERPTGKPGRRHEWTISARGFDTPLRSPMHAVGGLQGLFVTDGHSLHCLDPLTGATRWKNEGPLTVDAEEERTTRETLSPETLLAPAVGEDLVVAALQVPSEIVGASHVLRFNRYSVILKIPTRRLFAYDRWTGKLVWAHWDEKGGTLATAFNGHDVAAPPLVVADTIYVPTYDQTGAIQYYLTAYSLSSGKPIWRRLICSSQLEVNMFGNAQHEFAAAPLAFEGGVLYATTNLGVGFAVDARDGRIRWISAYDTIPMPATQLSGQMPRPVVFANSPGVVLEDVFVCTPLDSFSALAFDTKTGKLVWRMLYQAQAESSNNDIQWLLGALGDEVIFSGRGVVAVQAHPPTVDGEAQPRLIASPERIAPNFSPQPSRGAIAGGLIWLPVRNGIVAFDRDGAMPLDVLRSATPGNLLLQDGILTTVGRDNVEVYSDPQALLNAAESRTKTHGDDPFAWLNLATILRSAWPRDASEAYDEKVESCYRRGLNAARARGLVPGSPLVHRLSEGLFNLTLHRAERVARVDTTGAIRLLERARDEAPEPGLWIAAELQILRLLEAEGKDLTAELALLARNQGETVFTFPDNAGRIPAAAYALWRGVTGEKAPIQQAQRCQELLERYPDLVIAGDRVDDYAVRTLQRLIAKHGQSIYAPIEARAQSALSRVAGEHSSEALRWIVDTYPHSDAARSAMVRLLDEALGRGDGSQALHLFAQAARAGRTDARHVRRAIAAADKLGNAGLAARLTGLVLERWPQVVSGYAADGGQPLHAALQPVPPPQAAQAVLPKVPRAVIARLDAPSGGIGLQTLADITVVAGFPTPKESSLFVVEGSEKLRCFDLTREGKCFDEARFEVPFTAPMDHPQIWQTGSRLLLVESGRVRSLDALTGREEWSLEAPERRTFRCLGFQDGLAALWSEARDVDDGGQVWMIEPLSGASVAKIVYPAARGSSTPLLGNGQVLALDVDAEGALVLRHDCSTGELLGSLRPARDVQVQLGLIDSATAPIRLDRLARLMFANATTVFLPTEPSSAQSPPRLFAFDFSGKLQWSWKGEAGRTLERAGTFGEYIVIVEREVDRDRGGRVLLIDRTSHETSVEQRLQGRVRVVGWRAGRPAPGAFLVSETSPTPRVFWFALDRRSASFVHELGRNAEGVCDEPVAGTDFLALALLASRPTVVALDLRTRANLLADAPLRLPPGNASNFQLAPAGPYLALRSLRWIVLLGPEPGGSR